MRIQALNHIVPEMSPDQRAATMAVVGGDHRTYVLDAARREVGDYLDRIVGGARGPEDYLSYLQLLSKIKAAHDALAEELDAREPNAG